MKRSLVVCCVLAVTLVGHAQAPKYDSAAIYLMDRMSDVIGNLESVHFTLTTAFDEIDHEHGVVRHYGVDEVFMSGPNKMLVTTRNFKGHRQYMYNGSHMAYFSFTENNYGIIDAPSSTIAAIDQIHREYGVDFPAADFFYPTFTDDMIALFDEIRYLGKAEIAGRTCFHLLGKNGDMTAQFWIENDALMLPMKMLLIENNGNHIHYEATFSGWQINPVLPAAMFDFLPPPGARRLRIVAKDEL